MLMTLRVISTFLCSIRAFDDVNAALAYRDQSTVSCDLVGYGVVVVPLDDRIFQRITASLDAHTLDRLVGSNLYIVSLLCLQLGHLLGSCRVLGYSCSFLVLCKLEQYCKKDEGKLLKNSSVFAYDPESESDTFHLARGRNRFEVVFIGEYGGTYRKHDRLLPEIDIAEFTDSLQ